MKNGIGLDWGLKTLITCSNGFRFTNIYNTPKMIKLHNERDVIKKKYKLGDPERVDILRKINSEMLSLKATYYNDIITTISKWKPLFISIEDLDLKNTIKAIDETSFNLFVFKLKNMCSEKKIELRKVGRFFPSSKTCSRCGYVKHDLKYDERIFKCNHCGLEIDRDLNASINIRDTKNYTRLI